jgi:hypothetical protein
LATCPKCSSKRFKGLRESFKIIMELLPYTWNVWKILRYGSFDLKPFTRKSKTGLNVFLLEME